MNPAGRVPAPGPSEKAAVPVGHNGINHVHGGRASWVPEGVLYRGTPVPARIDPAYWSPRGRYRAPGAPG